MDGTERLFVYGTLRAHQSARGVVDSNILRWEPATTTGTLYALPQGYPGYVSGPSVVVGEVVWLTDVAATLQRLDAYEGDEYSRIVCHALLQSGRRISAWIYALTDTAAIRSATIIAGGDWVRHLANSAEVSRPR